MLRMHSCVKSGFRMENQHSLENPNTAISMNNHGWICVVGRVIAADSDAQTTEFVVSQPRLDARPIAAGAPADETLSPPDRSRTRFVTWLDS